MSKYILWPITIAFLVGVMHTLLLLSASRPPSDLELRGQTVQDADAAWLKSSLISETGE